MSNSNSIPIVQGIALDDYQHQQFNNNGNNYQNAQQSPYHNNNSQYQHQYGSDYAQVGYGNNDGSVLMMSDADREALRENPQRQFQDVFWAILFYAHLLVMVGVIGVGLSNADIYANNGNAAATSYSSTIFLVIVTGLSAVGLSIFALSFMMRNTDTLVQIALIFSVFTSGVIAILGFLSGDILMGVLGAISFLVGLCYARVVWGRIPYAAANLRTALSAVRANMGLTLLAYGFMIIAVAWTLFWFLGVNSTLSGDNGGNDGGQDQTAAIVVFLLFLSYYWTQQVLQNTMHVTTAGVVGTWWFVPEEASNVGNCCGCNRALADSFFRATTYSFGSICFGSFMVAFIQALRALEHHLRDRWAYVYVGLYGFDFITSGKNVLQLFESKGWTVIVSDNLCDNVLFMISVAIGLASGLIGLIIGVMDSNMFQDIGFDAAAGPAFMIGLFVGFLLSTIVMSVVGSAVNTVIVCYAEAPAEFDRNHPQLSQQMRAAWIQAWPGLIN